MLESEIIAAQSDDNFIERIRFEGEMLSDIDITRIEFESVQLYNASSTNVIFQKPAFTIRCLITAILQIAFLWRATGKAPKF